MKKYPEIRQPLHRERHTTPGGGESKVADSSKDETDVNAVIARFRRTGKLPEGRQVQYGDCTALQGDPTEMMISAQETIQNASEAITEAVNTQTKEKAEREKKDAEDLAEFRAAEAAKDQSETPGGSQGE